MMLAGYLWFPTHVRRSRSDLSGSGKSLLKLDDALVQLIESHGRINDDWDWDVLGIWDVVSQDVCSLYAMKCCCG